MLKSILMVPLLMGCALVGTVGLISAIKKFSPSAFKHTETTQNKQDTQDKEQSK